MNDGTLLELVSRGKKDAYQIQDPVRTWFGSPYEKRSAATREIRLLNPENLPRFGQWFDVVLPSDGDILTSFDLRITLPTWLPPTIAAQNVQPGTTVQIESKPWEPLAYPFLGTPPTPWVPKVEPPQQLFYGWCDGVANYMINRWALFVDNVMILDGYGEFNTWFPDMDTTQMQAPLIHAATGRLRVSSNGTNGGTNGDFEASLQANATLPELVFRVPIPGCQIKGDPGLPLCAFKNQRVYLRFWLLDKTELVQSSTFTDVAGSEGYAPTALPMYELCPTPWGGRAIYVNGIKTLERTLSATAMGQPYIYARTSILNIDNDLRDRMRAMPYEIRFRQQLKDYWTVNTFVPGVNYRQLLQINGFFQMLFLGFRSVARTKQNRYTDLLPSYGDWLTNLSLNVNGQDRIYPWSPKKFRTLANNTQLARDINVALYYLIFGISPDNEPGGACNLARCQKALLNLTFNDIQVDPMTAENTTYAFVLGMSWNVLDIRDGYARLRFPD